jgi:hypothetical protein
MRFAQFSTPETIADSKSVKTFDNWTAEHPPFIGWSWFIDPSTYDVPTVGHTGTQGGFYCNYVSAPEQELLLVILCNFPFDREQMTSDMMELLRNEGWVQGARNENRE